MPDLGHNSDFIRPIYVEIRQHLIEISSLLSNLHDCTHTIRMLAMRWEARPYQMEILQAHAELRSVHVETDCIYLKNVRGKA